MTQRIALTTGEPAGIGPDLALQLAQESLPMELVVFADPGLLRRRAVQLGIPVVLRDYQPGTTPQPQQAGFLTVAPVSLPSEPTAGQLDTRNAAAVLAMLRQACNGCMDGEFAAMVTGPVHKGIINDAGTPFSGHTEFLAELTGSDQVVMMLATEGLRVALATTHLPLIEVAPALNKEQLETTIRIIAHDLDRDFNLKAPRILVLGLNPHAGEGGHLGREEIEIITPVLTRLRQEGLNVVGPLPADTAFTAKYLDQCDVVLAMYHDQGLPVLKYKGFGQAANITLGLPIIRTSVDHGTALDLAATGQADAGSLRYALNCAITMVQHREQQRHG